MKRALWLLCCGAFAGCLGAVNLDNYPRPFSCDHNGGDGGQQCAVGWSCGFDDRCFDHRLDGGQLVDQWRCETNEHCPPAWQCGEAVDSIRNCQLLDAGAPSRCATDPGCQGGWRCAASNRCFDPEETDGGVLRDCERNGECPNGFRCGERVGLEQRCIQLDAGATSLCNTDQGCVGTYRCDTFAHRCVEITDVLTTGKTTGFTVEELNPRVSEPAPLLLAMTRKSRMPAAMIETPSSPSSIGVMMASVLVDGGLRVVVQLRDENKRDAGFVKVLFEKYFALPGGVGDVTDLAVSFDGPAVRFRDGGASRLWLADGGWESLGQVDFLRQRDPLDQQGTTELVWVSGSRVQLGDDSGVTFDSGVREVVAERDRLYAMTGSGFFQASISDGGADLRSPRTTNAQSKGAIAGLLEAPQRPPFFGIIAELPRNGGGTELVGEHETTVGWGPTAVGPPCPPGSSPLQLAFEDDRGMPPRPLVFSRCGLPDGGTFPVQVELGGSAPRYASVVEDQIPYRGAVVAQRSAPFVRAHAAANGRIWHAVDEGDRALLGRVPLRPLLLDRQPEAMLSFFDGESQSTRVLAVSNAFIFGNDVNGGLVSQLAGNSIFLLSFIAGTSWVVTTAGVIETGGGGKPRLMVTMPGAATLVPPATGVALELTLEAGLRQVILVASGDTIWVADVTDASSGPWAQPAVFEPVLVPVPGVRLRSMTLAPRADGGISGYLTTSTQNHRFGTNDLVRWSLNPVPTPALDSLPLEVWAEPDGGPGRTGFTDGRVWSLPIMVPLTTPLLGAAGGALTATDFARKCGDLFAATAEGIFRAESVAIDGGPPSWVPVTEVNLRLDSKESLRLYETHDTRDRLFVGTQSGQVLELSATCQ